MTSVNKIRQIYKSAVLAKAPQDYSALLNRSFSQNARKGIVVNHSIRCFSPLFATFSPLFSSEIKRGEKVDKSNIKK